MTIRSRKTLEIDREKLRAAVRKLGNEYMTYMLDDAIELLPPSKLCKLAGKYIDLEQLRPDTESSTNESLLARVKSFEKVSLAGDYYESFNVNSKNCTMKSTGTSTWIAAFKRHLGHCVTSASKSDPSEVREAMDILFGLLDHIDECLDDIIFLADEAGSWQVNVQWEEVLPVWFKVLSPTAEPDEYARRVVEMIENHCRYDRDKLLSRARRMATPEQRKALKQIESQQKSRR